VALLKQVDEHLESLLPDMLLFSVAFHADL
jgi:hypothetical protein